MRPHAIPFLLLLLGPFISLAAEEKSGLAEIQKVHVGPFGQSDEAERFRLLLKEKLAKSGFQIAEHPEEADAILKGVLVLRVYPDGARAYVTAILSSKKGEQLWRIEKRPGSGWKGDAAERRAGAVAGALKDAKQKAVKQKGGHS